MKLTEEIKNKIDSYFENITADELYDMLVNEFNFPIIEEEEYIG